MKIAFMGDSITEGCFELIPGQQENTDIIRDRDHTYDTILMKKLNSEYSSTTFESKNFGISGYSSEGGLKVVDDVISWKPDAVVVCFGLNDVCHRGRDAYTSNLNQIFCKINDFGSKSIFMTPNMMNTYVHEKTLPQFIGYAHETAIRQNDGTMDDYMESAKKVAKSANASVCDVYTVWKKLSYYGIDTTRLLCNYINHPTRKMHRLFADMLFDTCKEVLMAGK